MLSIYRLWPFIARTAPCALLSQRHIPRTVHFDGAPGKPLPRSINRINLSAGAVSVVLVIEGEYAGASLLCRTDRVFLTF